MKKVIAVLLFALLLVSIGCQKSNQGATVDTPTQAPTDAPTEAPTQAPGYTGSLTDLMNAIYEKVPVELFLGDPTAVDLTDGDALAYYTGLTDASDVEEVVYSEPMIGSQAYSLVLIRVKDGVDAKTVAENVKKNVNAAKWVCVMADDVNTAVEGDIVFLTMLDSQLELSTEAFQKAFSETVNSQG